MEAIQAHIIDYDDSRDHTYYNAKDKERRRQIQKEYQDKQNERLTMTHTGKSFRDTLKELGITYQCFSHRLKDNWSFARAITTPHRDLLETEYRDKIKRDLDRFMIRKSKMKYRQF